jgi:VanZ family protein
MVSRLIAAALSAAVVAILCALVVFWGPPANTRLWRELFNAGHAPLFGVVAVTILRVVSLFTDSSSAAFRRRYAFAAFASILLGGATELIQYFIGRDAELGDLIRDAVGTISFLAIAASMDRSARIGTAGVAARWAFRCCAGVLFLTAYISAASWSLAYLHRNSAFPTLASFETAAGSRFISVEDATFERTPPPEAWRRTADKMVGHVTFHPATYSTLTLDEPYPDWKGYSTLVVSLFSPGVDTISLVVRIEDRHHNGDFADRFNAAYKIGPGPNRIQIPLDRISVAPVARPMDMTAIAGLALFAANPGDTMSLYLDSMYLY